MGKHILSVLGTSLYMNSVYVYGGESYETSYVQEALLKLKFTDLEPGDKITVFLTEKAREENWVDRPYTEKEKKRLEGSGVKLPEIKEGLEQILKREYAPFLDDMETCTIPTGANEEELWTIFQVVFDHIQENETLYFDITHSFRTIPIQILAVINYARVVKNVQVDGIFYGAFEAGRKLEDGRIEVSILDMQAFLDMLDWSQAASSFIKYGNSDQMTEMYRIQKKKKRPEARQMELNKVIKEVENLTYGLETSRGYYSQKNETLNQNGKSILGSYRQYKEAYKNLQEKEEKEEAGKGKTILGPLRELLQVVDKRMQGFDVETNLQAGKAAIEWAIENKRTQQGFTALEETVKTFLCNYYGLDESTERDRDKICKNICQSLLRKQDGKDDKDLTEEKRLAKYDVWMESDYKKLLKKDASQEEANVLAQKAKNIFLTVPEELLPLIKEIGNCRNSMNHFGYSNIGTYSCHTLNKKLEKFYADWTRIADAMEEEKSKK